MSDADARRGLLAWLDAWLTLEQPVTYWSFWLRLVKVSPLLLVAVVVSVVLAGDALTAAPFAPVPYVFVAATFGFAVRRLETRNVALSAVIGGGYTAVLAASGLLATTLATPSPVLTATAILIFVGTIAGFAAPALHRGHEQSAQATQRWERRREE